MKQDDQDNPWLAPSERARIDAMLASEQAKKDAKEREQKSNLEDKPNYVLIDAALWQEDIEIIFSSDLPYRSLFRGSTGEKLWSVAPYLLDISEQKEFVQKIQAMDKIQRRVAWISSTLDIDSLRKHLRRFLRLKKEDDSYIYFRFYDPYVIQSTLPSLTEEQYQEFMTPIQLLIAEDTRINQRMLLFLSSTENKLQIVTQEIQTEYVDNK